MLFRYFSTEWGALIIGPLGSDEPHYQKSFSTFSSHRSPIDEKESNFLHVTSNWAAIRLDSGSPFTSVGGGIKFTCNGKPYQANGFTPSGVYALVSQSLFSVSQPIKDMAARYVSRAAWDERLGLGFVKYITWSRRGVWPLYTYEMKLNIRSFRLKERDYQTLSNIPMGTFKYTESCNLFESTMNSTLEEDLIKYGPQLASTYRYSWNSVNTSFTFSCDAALRAPIHLPLRESNHQDRLDKGDLSLECVKQVKAFSADTAVVASKLPSLSKLADVVPRNKGDFVNPNNWANAYLAFKYGVNLSLRDGEDIISGIGRRMSRQKMEYSTRRATLGHSSPAEGFNYTQYDVLHCKLKYFTSDNTMVKALRGLYDYGLMPTIGTAWDLIPYSFVVDWCLNVSDCLAAIDYGPQYATLSVKSVTYSKLSTVTGPIPPVKGCWTPPYGTTTYYSREVCSTAYEPIPRFEVKPPTTNNVVTGAALYIQRKL